MAFCLKYVVGIASDVVTASIRYRKSNILYKVLLAMRKQQNIQDNRLEYLVEAIIYGTYSANIIDEILDAINQLHTSFSKQEKVLSGRQF